MTGVYVTSIAALHGFRAVLAQMELGVEASLAVAERDASMACGALDMLIHQVQREIVQNSSEQAATGDGDATRFRSRHMEELLEDLVEVRRQLVKAIDSFQERKRAVIPRITEAVARASAFLSNHVESLNGYTSASPAGEEWVREWVFGGPTSLAVLGRAQAMSTVALTPYCPPFATPPIRWAKGPFPNLGTPPLGLSTASYQGISPSWVRREGDRMLLGFSTVAPVGALPWLGTAPTPTTSYLNLELSTADKPVLPLGIGTVPATYDLRMGTGAISVGPSAFEYAPSLSIASGGFSPRLATGGSSFMPIGGHGFGGMARAPEMDASMGFSAGFAGGPAMGS